MVKNHSIRKRAAEEKEKFTIAMHVSYIDVGCKLSVVLENADERKYISIHSTLLSMRIIHWLLQTVHVLGKFNSNEIISFR